MKAIFTFLIALILLGDSMSAHGEFLRGLGSLSISGARRGPTVRHKKVKKRKLADRGHSENPDDEDMVEEERLEDETPGDPAQDQPQVDDVYWLDLPEGNRLPKIPNYNNLPMLRDALVHRSPNDSPVAYGSGGAIALQNLDYKTAVHETNHGSNNFASSFYRDQGYEGFYFPGKGAFYIKKTGVPRSAAVNIIPGGLRGTRFETYIQDRNGRPPSAGVVIGSGQDADLTYLWDEGTCYVLGVLAAVEQIKAIGKTDNDDLVLGALEFLVYMGATIKATQIHNPNYTDMAQMKAAYKFLTEQTFHGIRQLEQLSPGLLSYTVPHMEVLRGSGGKGFMNFLGREFGADWVYENYGIMPDESNDHSSAMY